MPILKHAKKKLKQDKKRTIKNKKIKDTYKIELKKAKEKKTKDAVSKAFSAIDKAAKKDILSKNKAARLKSTLSKQHVSGKTDTIVTKSSPVVKQSAKSKKTVKTAAKTSKSSGAKKRKPSAK